MENTRELALEILLLAEKGEGFEQKLINAVLDKYDYLEKRDKSLIKRMVEGTVERQIELDYHLNHFSKIPVKKMKPLIRVLLRMSAYQILFLDSVPDAAACNEAVKLVQKRGFSGLKGFVNGVLRNLSREKEKLSFPDKEKDPVFFLSVKYSMPEWIVKMWGETYGLERTERILEDLLREHAVSFRVKTGLTKEEREALVRSWEEQGVKIRKISYLNYVFEAENSENIRRLPGFSDGKFTVQDVSSCLCVEAAGIRKEDVVMDLCAAPGGKTILASEKAKIVYSYDISEEKTYLIRENAERMRAENVHIEQHDAAVYTEEFREKADVVMLDVPCSGLGVIGKKRDIKYHVTLNSIMSLVKLQKGIVEACWQYVKPGGILIYSTCTIDRLENEEIAEWILKKFPFEPLNLKETLPGKLFSDLAETDGKEAYSVQLLPGYTRADGFFIAGFRRTVTEQ